MNLKKSFLKISIISLSLINATGCSVADYARISDKYSTDPEIYQSTPDSISDLISRSGDEEFTIHFDKQHPLKDAWVCNFSYEDGVGDFTFRWGGENPSDYGQHLIKPSSNCELNRNVKLMARDRAIAPLKAKVARYQEEKNRIYKEQQIKFQKELDAKNKEEEEKKSQRVKYLNSPQGAMDSISLVIAELDVCKQYNYISSSDANSGVEKIMTKLKNNLGDGYDKKYFTKSYNNNYNAFRNYAANDQNHFELMKQCQSLVASANKKDITDKDSRF